MLVKCSFKSESNQVQRTMPADRKSRAHFLVIDRFHWVELLAQVADSLFEWIFFFLLLFFLHFISIKSNEYIQWFTLIDMMNDKELWKRVIKMRELRRLIEKRKKTRENIRFDNGNSSREPNIMCVYRKNNKWKGALFYSLHRLQSTQLEYTNDNLFEFPYSMFVELHAIPYHKNIESIISQLAKKINVCDLSSFWSLKHIDWNILFGVRGMPVIWVIQNICWNLSYRYEMSSWALHLSQISFSC